MPGMTMCVNQVMLQVEPQHAHSIETCQQVPGGGKSCAGQSPAAQLVASRAYVGTRHVSHSTTARNRDRHSGAR